MMSTRDVLWLMSLSGRARVGSGLRRAGVRRTASLPPGGYRSVQCGAAPERVEGDPVQDHVVPPLVEPTTEGSLADLPARNATRAPHRVAFAKKLGDDWVDVTAAQFHDEVRAVAKGLVASGLRTGDRVGIMSKTRYEWTVADFAVWTAGGVS